MRKKATTLFEDLTEAFRSFKDEREGKITLKRTKVPRPAPLHITAEQIKAIRERLNCSRAVFARSLRINERSLESWEQGKRATPEWAAALILLVDKRPGVIEDLQSLGSAIPTIIGTGQ